MRLPQLNRIPIRLGHTGLSLLTTVFFSVLLGACGTSSPANSAKVGSPAPSASPLTTAETASNSVTIDSADGVKLVGTLLDSTKPNSPAVLLLHQWQSDRHSYDEFAQRMQSKGIAVLAIDGRGFGESTKKEDGTTVAAGRTVADVKGMLGDVDAAIAFLKKQKNVDPTKIAIVGASYGSSLALIYAADHPDIKAVALLSPGLNYFGNMPTRPAVEKYGERDLFMVASKGDEESAKALEGLRIQSPKHGFLELPTGSSHGTEMFKFRNATDGPSIVEDAVESFLLTRLSGEPQKPER